MLTPPFFGNFDVRAVVRHFIAQNLHNARLNFLWLHGNVTIGLAISLAFVLGAIFVLLIGVARVAQLRLVARRHRREDESVRIT